MQHTRRKFLYHLKLCFCVLVLASTALSIKAQTDSEAELQAFVLKAYTAYQTKDRQTLFSLHSESSPYFAEFKENMLKEFSFRGNVKIEGKRLLPIKVDVQGDKATVRLVVKMYARDVATGRKAEGFPEWDHTLYLVKEQGNWKLWRFIETGEELALLYLEATTDDERAKLVDQAKPVTYGLLAGLSEVGRSFLEDHGDDVHAAEILRFAARLAEETKDSSDGAGPMVGLGDVYLAQGDYIRAADNYQTVLTLAEKLGSKEGVAAVSVKMGNLHYAQGNFAQAMEHYLKSVRLYEELGSTIEITYPLANLGNAYFSLGNYEKALEHYQKVLTIYEQLSSRSGAAWLRNQIADVYAAEGKNELALVSYQQSLKEQETLGNKPMQAHSLYGIGRVRFTEAKYAEALELFGRAALLAKAGNSPEILWKILNLLGQTHRALHKNDEARNAFTEGIAVIERLRTQSAGSERDQELSFESKTTPYLEMVELLIEENDLAGAFVYAERAKGRMLLDVLRHGRADITKNMTAEERDNERSLNTSMTVVGSQIRHEISLPNPDQKKLADLEGRLQRARIDYEAYETRIHAAHPELKVQRGDTLPLMLSEAESLIPDQRAALLEYVVAPDKTYLFVLTRTETTGEESAKANTRGQDARATAVDLKVFSIPIASGELADRVRRFRETLAGNSLGFKEPARQLYDLLLGPAQKELEGKVVLGIVPSGQLWELPFQALLTKQDRYVLQEHALFYAPSLSVLREMRNKDAQRRLTPNLLSAAASDSMVKLNVPGTAMAPSLLAMGNPSLSASLVARATSDDRSLSLGSLPEAEREVKDLGEIYGAQRSKILTGLAAREETVKSEAGRYPILHFATHGLLDDVNPLYSRLLLASSNGDDDGFLEAREIMKLELHAELAVLSACQTARGKIGPGEGLIGMSWAFFIAGASTTVVSQWKVDSVSTARLMVDFHRALQGVDKPAHVNKAEALRRSALKLMANPKYRHPFFWSGFVVVGNGL